MREIGDQIETRVYIEKMGLCCQTHLMVRGREADVLPWDGSWGANGGVGRRKGGRQLCAGWTAWNVLAEGDILEHNRQQ